MYRPYSPRRSSHISLCFFHRRINYQSVISNAPRSTNNSLLITTTAPQIKKIEQTHILHRFFFDSFSHELNFASLDDWYSTDLSSSSFHITEQKRNEVNSILSCYG